MWTLVVALPPPHHTHTHPCTHHRHTTMFRRMMPKLTRSQFELAKFTFYLMTPISIMYYVGIDTDRKFNVPGYWPDPDTLNKIPKEPHEIQAELARIRQARVEKRRRLEEKARLLGITPDAEEDEEKKQDEQQNKDAETLKQEAIETVLVSEE